MNTYFICKIRYTKTMDNGMEKKVTEAYLVDALSFTEAEARIISEMTPFISGEFTVEDITKAKYSELFEGSGDKWYACKLAFITLDEKSNSEKKSTVNVLVQADDIREAIKNLDNGMKGTMADYVSLAITETSILEVYHFTKKEENVSEELKFSPD